MPRGKSDSINQKHYPDLGGDASSIWNFCSRFSDVIWRGNQRWCREMSQRAKKVLSDSPVLVDFAIGLVNSVFNLPDGLVMFYEESE